MKNNLTSLNMDIQKIKLSLVIAILALCLPVAAQSQDKELPLPAFPANFEMAVYKGQEGCIVDDRKYMFAVMKNEGLFLAGSHPLLDTPESGVHIMNFVYHPYSNYGYKLYFRNEGEICVENKIANMKFKNNVTTDLFDGVKHQVTESDCNFDVKAVNLCGSFKAVTTRMTKAGYEFDWSGVIGNGYSLTLITKDEQSFYLKTKNSTAATIITGVGKGAYKHYDAPSANRG